jgi:hypothetical protein
MPVRVELPAAHPHVAVVTLDRPERANALDPAMLVELTAAWRRIAEDAEIRCAVLTGAGEQAFCSGMDLRATIPAAQAWRAAAGDPVDFEGLRSVATATLAGFDLQTPLVCAVNAAPAPAASICSPPRFGRRTPRSRSRKWRSGCIRPATPACCWRDRSAGCMRTSCC